MNDIKKSIKALDKYVSNERWKGYDPYDGLNSSFTESIGHNSKWFRIFIIQTNRRSPINFRPIIGIKKGIDKKGSGLFSTAYTSLYCNLNENQYIQKSERILKQLKKKSLKNKYGHHCWSGHYFKFQSLSEYLEPDVPDIITTVTNGIAYLDHYKATKKKESIYISKDAGDFIIQKLPVFSKKAKFFKYTPDSPKNLIIYNASTHGIMLLCKLFGVTGNNKYKKISTDILDFIISKQNQDGSWDYSEKDGEIRKQIDFHQGFILDSIYEYVHNIKPENDKYEKSLRKGADFYLKHQFLPDGQAKYRYPQIWPIDSHNLAQGIITFSKLSEYDKKYEKFARTITNWTINNMFDKKGYFYYQKGKVFTNRIPYMRWSQAWMMLALATLLENSNEK